MSSTPSRNANVPQTEQPIANLQSLVSVVSRLKQGLDSLAGNRGSTTQRAVTFDDLVSLKLVAGVTSPTATTFSQTGGSSGTSGSGSTVAVVNPYVLTAFLPAAPQGVVFGHRFPTVVGFPAGFGAISSGLVSEAGAFVASSGSPSFSVQRCASGSDPTQDGNWQPAGTISFAGAVGSFTTAGNQPLSFQLGDLMRWVSSGDAALAEIYVTLVGTR